MFEKENNRFVLKKEGKEVAEITWLDLGNGVIDVNHTFVDPSLRGKGIAEQLVLKVIELANKKHLKIIPSCPYVASYFKNHTELKELIKE